MNPISSSTAVRHGLDVVQVSSSPVPSDQDPAGILQLTLQGLGDHLHELPPWQQDLAQTDPVSLALIKSLAGGAMPANDTEGALARHYPAAFAVAKFAGGLDEGDMAGLDVSDADTAERALAAVSPRAAHLEATDPERHKKLQALLQASHALRAAWLKDRVDALLASETPAAGVETLVKSGRGIKQISGIDRALTLVRSQMVASGNPAAALRIWQAVEAEIGSHLDAQAQHIARSRSAGFFGDQADVAGVWLKNLEPHLLAPSAQAVLRAAVDHLDASVLDEDVVLDPLKAIVDRAPQRAIDIAGSLLERRVDPKDLVTVTSMGKGQALALAVIYTIRPKDADAAGELAKEFEEKWSDAQKQVSLVRNEDRYQAFMQRPTTIVQKTFDHLERQHGDLFAQAHRLSDLGPDQRLDLIRKVLQVSGRGEPSPAVIQQIERWISDRGENVAVTFVPALYASPRDGVALMPLIQVQGEQDGEAVDFFVHADMAWPAAQGESVPWRYEDLEDFQEANQQLDEEGRLYLPLNPDLLVRRGRDGQVEVDLAGRQAAITTGSEYLITGLNVAAGIAGAAAAITLFLPTGGWSVAIAGVGIGAFGWGAISTWQQYDALLDHGQSLAFSDTAARRLHVATAGQVLGALTLGAGRVAISSAKFAAGMAQGAKITGAGAFGIGTAQLGAQAYDLVGRQDDLTPGMLGLESLNLGLALLDLGSGVVGMRSSPPLSAPPPRPVQNLMPQGPHPLQLQAPVPQTAGAAREVERQAPVDDPSALPLGDAAIFDDVATGDAVGVTPTLLIPAHVQQLFEQGAAESNSIGQDVGIAGHEWFRSPQSPLLPVQPDGWLGFGPIIKEQGHGDMAQMGAGYEGGLRQTGRSGDGYQMAKRSDGFGDAARSSDARPDLRDVSVLRLLNKAEIQALTPEEVAGLGVDHWVSLFTDLRLVDHLPEIRRRRGANSRELLRYRWGDADGTVRLHAFRPEHIAALPVPVLRWFSETGRLGLMTPQQLAAIEPKSLAAAVRPFRLEAVSDVLMRSLRDEQLQAYPAETIRHLPWPRLGQTDPHPIIVRPAPDIAGIDRMALARSNRDLLPNLTVKQRQALPMELIEILNLAHWNALQPREFATFLPRQIANIPADIWAGLDPALIAALPPPYFRWITEAQSSSTSAAQWRALSHTQLQEMPKVPPDLLHLLSAGQIDFIAPHQVPQLDLTGLDQLSNAALRRLRNWTFEGRTSRELSDLPWRRIGQTSSMELVAWNWADAMPSPLALARADEDLLVNMSSGQRRMLAKDHLDALTKDHWRRLARRPELIADFSTSQIALIRPDSLAVIDREVIARIPPEAIAGLTLEQWRAMNFLQHDALQPAQIQVLPLFDDVLDKLPVSKIRYLTPDQVARLGDRHFKGVSPSAIAAFIKPQLAVLTEQHFRALSREQAQAFTIDQRIMLEPLQRRWLYKIHGIPIKVHATTR